MSRVLSAEEGATLVALARGAIEERLFGGALDAVRARIRITEGLSGPRGCFVTLKAPGPAGRLVLRGCIGSIEARLPAHEAVVEAAVHAAFEDPRFAPLRPEESATILVSVSALTPPAPVPSAAEVVAGRHGVVLEAEGRRAVFLPEVAAEQGWTTVELLENLSRKAGLPASAWRTARLQVFFSEHFAETREAPARIRRS